MSALTMVYSREKFERKFTAKMDFPIEYFLRTLFDKYLDHMLAKFEQNRMVRTIQNFWLFDKNG